MKLPAKLVLEGRHVLELVRRQFHLVYEFSQVFPLLAGHRLPVGCQSCDQQIGLFGPLASLGHAAERIDVVRIEPVAKAARQALHGPGELRLLADPCAR